MSTSSYNREKNARSNRFPRAGSTAPNEGQVHTDGNPFEDDGEDRTACVPLLDDQTFWETEEATAAVPMLPPESAWESDDPTACVGLNVLPSEPVHDGPAVGGGLEDHEVPEIIESYRVIEKLGAGGMGAVFKAEHKDLGRITALKIIKVASGDPVGEENASRFLREARLAAAVEHPNLVTLYGYGRQDNLLFMAMRFVDGGDVDQKLRREGVLPERTALRIMLDCSKALMAIAGANMVHRDIKPGNIFQDAMGNSYIGDLGLACLATEGVEADGRFAGTPAYTSPEQAQAIAVDIRSDIYSLGACLFFMSTGVPPFEGSSPFEVLAKAISAETPDPRTMNPNMSDELASICMRAMAKDPYFRYPDPRELFEDLEAVNAGRPPLHTTVCGLGEIPEAVCRLYERRGTTRRHVKRKVTVVDSSEKTPPGPALEQENEGFGMRLVRRFRGRNKSA